MKCHTSSQPGTYVPQDQGLERDWPGVSAERESLLCRVLEKKKGHKRLHTNKGLRWYLNILETTINSSKDKLKVTGQQTQPNMKYIYKKITIC